jgi:hypothetical protein
MWVLARMSSHHQASTPLWSEWLVPKSPVAYHTLGLLPVCLQPGEVICSPTAARRFVITVCLATLYLLSGVVDMPVLA